MKRFLPVILSILLIVSLSVPVFAESSYLLAGRWVFNDVLTVPTWNVQSVNFDMHYTIDGTHKTSSKIGFRHDSYNDLEFMNPDGNKYAGYYDFDDGVWKHDFKIVDFGKSSVSVSPAFYEWFVSNATPIYPALSNIPSLSGNNFNDVVLLRSDGYFYMALTSDTPYSVSGSVGDNYLITVANEHEVSYVTYKCTDGENWVHNSSGKAYSLSVGDSSATLLDSSFDWYKDGKLFFQVPLWEKVEAVTQGETVGLQATMGGTMKTLVLCGVGCLALLMVLVLCGKKFRLFLKK